MKHIILISLIMASHCCVNAQSKIYHWDKNNDGVLLGTAFGAWVGSKYLKSQVNLITEADLPYRDPDYLWSFDRGATSTFSQKADGISDILLFSSFALPYTHYLSKNGRGEGFAIAGMALQTLFITDATTNTIKAMAKRFRPYTYNPDVPTKAKLNSGARYSFVSGHTSITAAFGFFSAKVYSDLYPESPWKPVVWTIGATIPAVTGYLRYRAGKHFPTDIIGGYILGAATGFLVPHLHKKKRNLNFMLIPASGGMVMHTTFQF